MGKGIIKLIKIPLLYIGDTLEYRDLSPSILLQHQIHDYFLISTPVPAHLKYYK